MKWVPPISTLDATEKKLARIGQSIAKLEQQARTLRAKAKRRAVPDYEMAAAGGRKTRLSELFGDKEALVLVHNMGKGCGYCTMWADGYNALFERVAERAAFAVASPDAPADQQKLAKARGWRFPMVSAAGSSLFRDMGFEDAKGQPYPGVTTFVKGKNGAIERYAGTPFGPGDKFCSVFSFFDLLPAKPQ